MKPEGIVYIHQCNNRSPLVLVVDSRRLTQEGPSDPPKGTEFDSIHHTNAGLLGKGSIVVGMVVNLMPGSQQTNTKRKHIEIASHRYLVQKKKKEKKFSAQRNSSCHNIAHKPGLPGYEYGLYTRRGKSPISAMESLHVQFLVGSSCLLVQHCLKIRWTLPQLPKLVFDLFRMPVMRCSKKGC